MIYGCIGRFPPHSFIREIHEMIGDCSYDLGAIPPEGLDSFLRARPFTAVNVEAAYADAVLPHMDQLSETARSIGAADTIVNREGRLLGYNTGYYGLSRLMDRMGLDLKGKNVLVLGIDSTARAASRVAKDMGAAEFYSICTDDRKEALKRTAMSGARVDVIVNTASHGLGPASNESPIRIEDFPGLLGVIDTEFHPLRTKLVRDARALGIPAVGGLYMQVARAIRSAELFRGVSYPEGFTDEIYTQLLSQKENIVLVGMPGSGKSTTARIIGRRLDRPVADVDVLVEERAGMPIREIFARFGETRFRDLESAVIGELSAQNGLVIASGGGSVLRPSNVDAFRSNGTLILLDRPLEALEASDDRPLGDTREKVARLYLERMPLYRKVSDIAIDSAGTLEEAALEIEDRWKRAHAVNQRPRCE